MSDKKNPFAGYQQDKVASRTAVIEAHLTELSKRRTHFKYITDLAAALAEKVGEVEGVPCWPRPRNACASTRSSAQ